MSGENWRNEKRNHGGSIKTINGILYARVQYVDQTTGKRKEKLRRADNRTHARQLIKQMRAEYENHGEETLQSDKLTFGTLAKKYEETELIPAVYSDGRKVAGRRSLNPQKSLIKPLIEHFGRKNIRTIKTSDVKAYKAKRLNTPVEIEVTVKDFIEGKNGKQKLCCRKETKQRPRKIASVNRELQLLRAIFNFAKSDKLIVESPFDRSKDIISASAEVERDRVLSHAEEMRLLAACVDKREHLRPLVITAVDTGMRKGELLKLQWKDVDLFAGTINVQATNTKTEKARTIGMTARVRAELKRLWEISPKDETEIVFGITDNFKRSFGTACREAGIENLRFHDLRHTCITRLIRAGVPHSEAMKISGHREIKTFQRYMNLTSESVNATASLLDAYLSNSQGSFDGLESHAVN
ncbi:MAG TPA: site-specific integrase [Pyrinomonadaceae bacterium]